MIDVETELFSEVSSKVRAKYPKLYITGEYVKSPSDFPCASLVVMNNVTFRRTQTTEGQENHAEVTLEVNVYSNKDKGKKAECKAIIAFIDELLMRRNFTRIMLEPVPNQDNATIYRILGRYRALVGQNHIIYRR